MSGVAAATSGSSLAGAQSVCQLFQDMAARSGHAVALRNADGSVSITWNEYVRGARLVSAGLAKLGIGRGDAVAMMLVNRPEFHICDVATMHLGATAFSIYNTLGTDTIGHLLANSGATVVITEQRFAGQIDRARRGTAVEHVINVDGGDDHGARSLRELEALGDADFDFEASWRAVVPEDVLTLIYTSGTTGPPKGVELTHANILAELAMTAPVLPIVPGDKVPSALPMAHVAERWGTHYRSIAHGLEVTCIEDPTMLIDAVRKLRPTIWGSVPRIYEKLHAGLEAAFAAERDEVRRAAVQQAIEVGVMKVRAEQAAERGSGPGPDAELRDAYARADELVFSALRAGLGLDRVRWSIVGAAPTPLHILEFFAAIGLPIQELWGMSELSTVATVNPVDRIRFGTVGPPLPGLELKIAPDGEVLVRGATVMRGYRDEPEKTAEAIDADGWLYTGDIGTLDDDGYLKIVDRKKELIINAAGKNMSPANIEAAIKAQSPLIGQAVTVGDGRRFNVALIVLDAEVGAAYAASHHIPDASIASLASNQAARQEVAEAIERGNRSLARVEQIKRFVILDHEWEPGDGQLTPTMKLKRRPIAERYAEEIESLYRR